MPELPTSVPVSAEGPVTHHTEIHNNTTREAFFARTRHEIR